MSAVTEMLRVISVYNSPPGQETAIWQTTEKFTLAELVALLYFTLVLLYSSWSVLMKPIAYELHPNCDIGDANKVV